MTRFFALLRRPWDAMWAFPVSCPECGLGWEDLRDFRWERRQVPVLNLRGCRHGTAEVRRTFRPWRWVLVRLGVKGLF